MFEGLHAVVGLIEGNWAQTHVLVVGDVMLDKYIWGEVDRISPEAPVPVVRASHQTEQPGGAANVAMNLAGLGSSVKLVGFTGKDPEQEALEAILTKAGVTCAFTALPGFPTTSKLRILGGKQQMLRLDVERTTAIPAEAHAKLVDDILSDLPGTSVIVLSDYAKGVLTDSVCQSIIQAARKQHIPVLVDPKSRSFERYRGATTICPNLHELSSAIGKSMGDLDELLSAAQGMLAGLELSYLTVTLSEKGIAVVREGGRTIAPAVARQVYDVSGAGDTVIATLALCVACGLEIETAVRLANVAAGIVVSKVGTVPIQKHELIGALSVEIALHAEEKVLPLDRLATRAAAWRASGQRVVFTNGCFDILHIGHITLLEQARNEGDRLIVAINSDRSVSGLKGPTRPLVGERERAQILAALSAVDAVITFDESTPMNIIQLLHPDVIVKGGDYTEESVVGAREVRSWGGRVKIVPIVGGFSTTKLIAKAMSTG